MKKSILTAIAIFACGLFASAQEVVRENPNEEAIDKLQQEPPRPAERQVELTAKRSAENNQQAKKQKSANQMDNEKAVMDKPKSKPAKSKPVNGQVNPPQ
jgi:hypothetical protein